MIEIDFPLQQIENLLKKAKLSADILSIKNCGKGGNNRTYCLETADGLFAVKKYFREPADKRDRLASEFSFLLYAKQVAPDFVPTPYAQNAETGMALYEFIQGESFEAGNITENELSQAIQFFCAINEAGIKEKALHLSLASEAGFSVKDHLDSVGARIQQLQQAIASEKQHDAHAFMSDLNHYWQSLVKQCEKTAALYNLNIATTLDRAQHCLSPSDFGFHNALKMHNQRVRFLDFEYAGWDDPARMVNDFFAQLAVPIPHHYYDWFVREVMQVFPQPDLLIQRANILKTVYQVKWCCIAMNVFIPVHMARRQFANPHLNMSEVRQTQLAKAELLLKTLEVSHYGLY
ncbi:MAG: phosphotransferase [Gammaproteobacteria bacterium]|nr:phosphotransferase [Gammaproteobacteria bacterium]